MKVFEITAYFMTYPQFDAKCGRKPDLGINVVFVRLGQRSRRRVSGHLKQERDHELVEIAI